MAGAELAERVDPERARAILDSALVSARVREDRWWLPEVMRQRAAWFLTADEATVHLESALALAQEQGSVALAERCRHDLDLARTPAERLPS